MKSYELLALLPPLPYDDLKGDYADSDEDNGNSWHKPPMVFDDQLDFEKWEKLFHNMSQEQLELVICFYLGLKPSEIVDTLDYTNIMQFYNKNTDLREYYKKLRSKILAYN
jgi:hypothetical protein